MTELSYTAWDDNKYQWPPPDGWYQASDGKWWPEGYGPVATQASTDTTAEATGSDVASTDDQTLDASVDEGSAMPESDVDGSGHHETFTDAVAVEEGLSGEQTPGEFESGYNAAIAEVGESPQAAAAEAAAAVDADVESVSEVAAGATSEYQVAEAGHSVDLDDVASGFAESTETAYPSESQYDSDSRYSTSSAGMAASGFASRSDSGSSSLGLAGWAQPGASEVRNRVDVSHEYDYSADDGEPDDLLDPIEVSDEAHDLDLDASRVETGDLDTANLDPSRLETTDSPIDGPSEPVDSTLSRLDDLKRQVEEQSFATNVEAADATTPVSDFESGFDPTETLDIDPNDLKLESNPFYGGANETDAYAATPAVSTDEPAETSAYNGDYGAAADTTVDGGYGDRVEAASESYGYNPVGDATIAAPPAAETHQYGYEGEAPAPTADPTMPMGDGYVAPQNDYSSVSTLTPTSTPTPRPGPGRIVLYGVILLLALAVAGVAGYLLFQLQSDEGDGSGGESATATVDGSDAGPSDLSGQEPGSFSNPHELAGGVRLTVPVGDDDTEVWMLQVREPATASDMGDELVEVTSRIRVRNDSSSGDLSASGLRFVLVSADGSTGTTAAASCSSGDDLNRQAAIEPGKDIEGNVCWTVPAAQASGALLGVESVHAGGRVHVQLS